MHYYKIADILVEWDDQELHLFKGKYMNRFQLALAESIWEKEKICLKARMVSLEKYLDFPILKENHVYTMFDVHGERMLIYHWGNQRFAFAIWPDRITAKGVHECWFDPDMLHQPPLNEDWFFGVSGLHKALLFRGAVVLHASYIDRNGRAVLFTAPSGTGKSTQAALWEQFMHTKTVNGDRVLLREHHGIWNAYGYPCCGSSGICLNLTLPIQCIVVLQQGQKNRIEQLNTAQKIRYLTAAAELYAWNAEEVQMAIDVVEQVIRKVSVICLTCRPDAEAVRVLNDYLEEMEYAGTIGLSASESIQE